jgi:hypothetical protein
LSFTPDGSECKSCGFIELTLRDYSALKGQTCLLKRSLRVIQLLENVPCERIENIIGKLIIELRALIFSYNVTTIAADGSAKLSEPSGIAELSGVHLHSGQRELNFVHSNFLLGCVRTQEYHRA